LGLLALKKASIFIQTEDIVGEGGVQPHDDGGKIGLHPGWVGGVLMRVNVSTKIVPTSIMRKDSSSYDRRWIAYKSYGIRLLMFTF
jgi:hypothetical protein